MDIYKNLCNFKDCCHWINVQYNNTKHCYACKSSTANFRCLDWKWETCCWHICFCFLTLARLPARSWNESRFVCIVYVRAVRGDAFVLPIDRHTLLYREKRRFDFRPKFPCRKLLLLSLVGTGSCVWFGLITVIHGVEISALRKTFWLELRKPCAIRHERPSFWCVKRN